MNMTKSIFLLLLSGLVRISGVCSELVEIQVDGDSKTEESSVIPVVDLAAWSLESGPTGGRERIRQQVAKACRDIGFFAIVGHGVNEIVIDQAWKTSASFFDLPVEQKLEAKTKDDAEYPYGYERNEKLRLGKEGGNGTETPADLKETFSIGPSNPQSGMPSRRFPVESSDLKPALEAYYAEMERLANKILEVFAAALDLPLDWFDDKMNRHISALRILNYFPFNLSDVPANAMRATAHTDYGALTILKSGGPGLQVKKDVEGGAWADVPYLHDGFVVNLGDMMQRWTNDKWVSTLHRVVVPVNEDSLLIPRRQSIAFFVNVNGDTVVEPIGSCTDKNQPNKYPPIAAREYLMAKHLASMGHQLSGSSDPSM